MNITSKMTTRQINAALKQGGEFTFKAGDYTLTDTLWLCSNTKVICEEGAVFTKTVANKPAVSTYFTAKTTKYKGAHDVLWKGGEFKASSISQKSMFRLFHAKNVEVDDVTIGKCGCVHYIEVNACQNVAIMGCTFKDKVNQKGKEYKEAVQIDYAYYDGLPEAAAEGSACFDHTHCRDIKVIDCNFSHIATCIGTHTRDTETDKFHKGIMVAYCWASGMEEGNFINLYNMRGVEISNNVVSGYLAYVKSRGANAGWVNDIELKA